MRILFALILTAAPAWAQSPMTATEFEAYVKGRTLSFGTLGNPSYGVEMYLPDRRVLWSGAPGECTNGTWFARDDSICFLYEDDPEEKCWEIYDDPAGLRAVFTTRPDTTVIFEAVKDAVPLVCNNLGS